MEVATQSSFEPVPGTSQQLTKSGICEVCTVKDAKYTCPRCEVKTCCLRCSAIHKRELECNGNRDKTKFIRLEKFSNLNMSSDYHLLEEIGRSIVNYKKGLKKKQPRDYILPSNLYRLQKSAQNEKIYLKYLPSNFQRRKSNKSRLEYKENLINWSIEFVFVNADCLRVFESLVLETTELKTVLEKRLSDEKLQDYSKVGLSGARYFLKAEEISGNKFYEMDISKTVAENLRGKVIIEYPIIHVVLNDFAVSVDVIKLELLVEDKPIKMDADENNQANNNEQEEIYTCMKNLLFINDDI